MSNQAPPPGGTPTYPPPYWYPPNYGYQQPPPAYDPNSYYSNPAAYAPYGSSGYGAAPAVPYGGYPPPSGYPPPAGYAAGYPSQPPAGSAYAPPPAGYYPPSYTSPGYSAPSPQQSPSLPLSSSTPALAPSPVAPAPAAEPRIGPSNFRLQLPNMHVKCYIKHGNSNQYLVVDDGSPDWPVVLSSRPQAWQVTYVDDRLVGMKSFFDKYLSHYSPLGLGLVKQFGATRSTFGEEETFRYIRRDDNLFSFQSSLGRFVAGDSRTGKVKCEDKGCGVNGMWELFPLDLVDSPPTAASLAPVVQTVDLTASVNIFVPIGKPAPKPAPPRGDRLAAADLMIELVQVVQAESEACNKQLGDAQLAVPDSAAAKQFSAHLARLQELSLRVRKLKKAVKRACSDATSVPVNLLRASGHGISGSLLDMASLGQALLRPSSKAEENKKAFSNAYVSLGFSIKSALQAAEILKTSGPEVLLDPKWEQETVVGDKGKHVAPSLVTSVTAKPAAPAPAPAPAPPPRHPQISPQEEKLLRSQYDEKKVIKVQKYVRRLLARKHLLKLVKDLQAHKEKSALAAKQRKNVVFEILSTEQSYVKVLKALVEVYIDPITVAMPGFSTAEISDLVHFFGTLSGIYGLNTQLLTELEARIGQWPTLQNVGDILLKYLPMMKIYSSYVNDYEDILTLVTRVTASSKNFADLLANCKSKAGSPLDFESMIIQPVQRLPRYQLLIKEVLKFTDSTHGDFKDLTEALKKSSEVNLGINSAKREKDNRLLKVKCAQSIRGIPFDLLSNPARTYVREATLRMRRAGDTQSVARTYHVFLFNDILIFAVQVSRSITEFAEVVTFKGLDILPAEGASSFKLSNKELDRELVVDAPSEAEKEAWVKDLKSYSQIIKATQKVDESLEGANRGFQILSAIYGEIGKPERSRDVTAKLKEIFAAQGGGSLRMPAGGRPTLFHVTSSGFGATNQLQVVFTLDGQAQSRTFSDSTEVVLP